MTNNWEDLAYRFRWQIALLLVGITLAAGGVFITLNSKQPEIEILTNENTTNRSNNIRIEVSGAVYDPGVYELPPESRIDDAINKAGGITSSASHEWIDKYLNRAAFINDGQKIYIPAQDEQSDNATASIPGRDDTVSNVLASEDVGLVNINNASQSELEALDGIGPVYAQKIIENRPYSFADELETKSIIPKSTYEKIKTSINVY